MARFSHNIGFSWIFHGNVNVYQRVVDINPKSPSSAASAPRNRVLFRFHWAPTIPFTAKSPATIKWGVPKMGVYTVYIYIYDVYIYIYFIMDAF